MGGVYWGGDDGGGDVLPCVVDYGELCLGDGVVGSAIVQIETSGYELTATGEFIGVVEDLGFEKALRMDVSLILQSVEVTFTHHWRQHAFVIKLESVLSRWLAMSS